MRNYSEEDFVQLVRGLMPRGRVWPKHTESFQHIIVSLIARALVRSQKRWLHLIQVESHPGRSVEMLPDWEFALGLPDKCSPADETLQERQQAAHSKLTFRGGQSIPFFTGLAASLGYPDIEIEEFQPFVCGGSVCGDLLNGPDEVRHEWQVTVPGERVVDFLCGVSECGDSLGTWRAAEDLECRFEFSKPAHSYLIFNYEGA